MNRQFRTDPVVEPALAAAAASFLDVVFELHAAGRNVVTDLIGDTPFTQWDHFPPDDFHDTETGALFFYHAHAPSERVNGEHGHFHCFVEQSRIATDAEPIYHPAHHESAKALCHLVAVSIDMNGLPCELFTTNQWVTGEWLYPANLVVPLIDSFRFPQSRHSSLVSRWLSDLIALFRPQIAELLEERDRILGAGSKLFPKRVRRRAIEVVSKIRIDVDAQIEAANSRRCSLNDRV